MTSFEGGIFAHAIDPTVAAARVAKSVMRAIRNIVDLLGCVLSIGQPGSAGFLTRSRDDLSRRGLSGRAYGPRPRLSSR